MTGGIIAIITTVIMAGRSIVATDGGREGRPEVHIANKPDTGLASSSNMGTR